MRFRPPEPHPGWQGLYNATAYRNACHTAGDLHIGKQSNQQYSEDCLTVAVYVPPHNPSSPAAKKPVVAW